MDRLIRMAWRAFWVGLGASAVLVTQSLAAPGAPTAAPSAAPTDEAPSLIGRPYAALATSLAGG
jgi:hypothetical protein